MTRIINPTMKMFVRRLEQMCDRAEGDDCKAYCPAHAGFKFDSDVKSCIPRVFGVTPPENTSRTAWCIVCTVFMSVERHDCPCFVWGTNAIPEARKRIAAWRKVQEQEATK